MTYRQIALLFGIANSAVDRALDHLAPLAISPVTKKHSPDTVLIVDRMLVPTYNRSIIASSKSYRCSLNTRVVTDANTRLTVAVGAPASGNRHDCGAYRDSEFDQQRAGARVITDGGYRDNPGVIMPHRNPGQGTKLPA